ncbi:MAG: response regulator [Candidatus Latescibacteria bacterium]|nr:response regulator [Candidatus Latescibacterota bacterium]
MNESQHRANTILVVDDDSDIVDALAIILESAGYRVDACSNSRTCLEMLASGDLPDAIVLDIMLETISDGFTLGRDLKEHPLYRDIPIIAISSIEKLTGFPVDKDYLHIDEFLEKPLRPALLLHTIEKCLNRL